RFALRGVVALGAESVERIHLYVLRMRTGTEDPQQHAGGKLEDLHLAYPPLAVQQALPEAPEPDLQSRWCVSLGGSPVTELWILTDTGVVTCLAPDAKVPAPLNLVSQDFPSCAPPWVQTTLEILMVMPAVTSAKWTSSPAARSVTDGSTV